MQLECADCLNIYDPCQMLYMKQKTSKSDTKKKRESILQVDKKFQQAKKEEKRDIKRIIYMILSFFH